MQNTGSADHLQLSLSSLMLVGRKSRTLSFFAAFSISPLKAGGLVKIRRTDGCDLEL
jgi:hypothetical protein